MGGLVAVQLLVSSSVALAQEALLSQSSILDIPNGPKQSLREAGIDLAVNYTGFYQGLTGGAGDHSWEYGGKTDVIATLVGQKFGFWSGLFITAHGEFVHGDDVLNKGDGSILPVNTAMGFPRLGGHDEDFSLVVTQIIDEKTSLSVGKFNLLDVAVKTPLAGGGGLTTFFNTGLAAPISGVTPPYLLGGILNHKIDSTTLTLMVYDPRNAQASDVIRHPFSDGVTTSLSATFATDLNGLPGFYGIRGVYSTKNGTDFSDIPELILPPESQNIATKDGYWYASASFQQYLFLDPEDPKKGWGIWGQFGISDGNPNPIRWSALGGIGGNSIIPGRSEDTWGIGYFYYGFSEDLKDGLAALAVPLNDESGLEAFYNVAATPWFHLTVDGQITNPGAGSETAYFLGLRTQIKLF